MPNLIDIKNEIVFWLALISGGTHFLVTQINDLGIESVNDIYGLIVVGTGFAQRSGAYGRKTVEDIKARYARQ